MTPELLQQIQIQQAKALKACSSQDETAKLRDICNSFAGPITTGVLFFLKDCDSADVSYALGDIGVKLKSFSQFIDFESPHPELRTLFEGALVKDCDFCKDMDDLYHLMIQARERKCSSVIVDNLRRLAVLFQDQALRNSIDSPAKNLRNVRFVSDPKVRNEIRNQKKFQSIGLRTEFSRSVWDEYPEDFSGYCRFSNRHVKELSDAKAKLDHFYDLGLPLMAQEIEKSVIQLTKLHEEGQYLGFNKISLTTAAMMLAKMHDYTYEMANSPEESVIYTRDRRVYTPIAYTLEESVSYASAELTKTIELFEAFPEMNNKPIFDHYRVLVPSFDHSIMSRLSSTISPSGNPIFHVKSEKNPDFTMIKEGQTIGIFLGERDGQLYFLSYWM